MRLSERGTAYATPIDCKFKPLPKGVDCKAKIGRMMYDNMTVVVAASQDISGSLKLTTDADRRQLHNFSLGLKTAAPVVVGWGMGNDAIETKNRVEKLMGAKTAMAALDAQTAAANAFITTEVPQLDVKLAPGSGSETEVAMEADRFKVEAGHVCHGSKYSFIAHVGTVGSCEANCSADSPACSSSTRRRRRRTAGARSTTLRCRLARTRSLRAAAATLTPLGPCRTRHLGRCSTSAAGTAPACAAAAWGSRRVLLRLD